MGIIKELFGLIMINDITRRSVPRNSHILRVKSIVPGYIQVMSSASTECSTLQKNVVYRGVDAGCTTWFAVY
jgi:hypothetical protein